MKIAVASGKGGTGKTTVSVNLAVTMASRGSGRLQLVDCDVEEPNVHLFIRPEGLQQEVATIQVPQVDRKLCDGCGKCAEACQFHAIVSIGTSAMVFPEMCHSCGGCRLACPRGAITEVPRRIGVVDRFRFRDIDVVQGRLDVGVAMAPPLIRKVKAMASPDSMVLFDAPPGTSCPVIATLKDCDFVLLVTEPTPFGLHDLKIAVELIRELDIPSAVIVNRAGSGDNGVHEFCEENSVPIIMEIPDDRRVAEAYSRGELIVEHVPGYRDLFFTLADRLPVK